MVRKCIRTVLFDGQCQLYIIYKHNMTFRSLNIYLFVQLIRERYKQINNSPFCTFLMEHVTFEIFDLGYLKIVIKKWKIESLNKTQIALAADRRVFYSQNLSFFIHKNCHFLSTKCHLMSKRQTGFFILFI